MGQFGIGQAVKRVEDLRLLRGGGRFLADMEYALPRADSLCDIVLENNPVPTALNPLGVKGAGEAGTVGALPVVMNAVMHALAPLGVRELDMPASSERVWQAVRQVIPERIRSIP